MSPVWLRGNAKLRGAQSLRRFPQWSHLAQPDRDVRDARAAGHARPSFPAVFLPAAALAVVLILVARPIAIWLCLAPFRFTNNETTFIAWVGLRGAVSILLAIVPILLRTA